jgi:pimeloyl-ACP methyl ester carboxylesterase
VTRPLPSRIPGPARARERWSAWRSGRADGASGRSGRPGRVQPPDQPLIADVSGNGPPVVLLHGQPGSAADWHSVTPLLAGDFMVIVPDRPGYGRTGGTAANFEGNAARLSGLLDGLGVERAIVAGYSWAGGVALAFGEMFPERTAGLVLAASVGPGEDFRWEDRILAAPLVGEAVAALTLGTLGRLLGSPWVQRVVDRRPFPRAREMASLRAASTGASTHTPAWRAFVAEQRVLLQDLDSLGPRLGAVVAPSVVINGSADRLVPPRVGDALAAAIPGATHVTLRDAGHLLPYDQPGPLAAAVRRVASRARWS